MKALLLSLCLSASVSTSAFLQPVKNKAGTISNISLGTETITSIGTDQDRAYNHKLLRYEGSDNVLTGQADIWVRYAKTNNNIVITYVVDTYINQMDNYAFLYGGMTNTDSIIFTGSISQDGTKTYTQTTTVYSRNSIQNPLSENYDEIINFYETEKLKANTIFYTNNETTTGTINTNQTQQIRTEQNEINLQTISNISVVTINEITINSTNPVSFSNVTELNIAHTLQLFGQETLEINTINYEVVDIPGLILTILVMPFTFVSKAFGNFTLFPGTIYQVNIGNLILIILLATLIMFIIKKFK